MKSGERSKELQTRLIANQTGQLFIISQANSNLLKMKGGIIALSNPTWLQSARSYVSPALVVFASSRVTPHCGRGLSYKTSINALPDPGSAWVRYL